MSTPKTINAPGPMERKISRRFLVDLAAAANESIRTVFDPRNFRVTRNGRTQSISLADQTHPHAISNWFRVTGRGTTIAKIGEGFGQYAATVTRISDDIGTQTVSGFSTNGTYILRAVLDLPLGTWTFDSVTYSGFTFNWDGGDDDTRTYAIARIVVASKLIAKITQMQHGAVLYESRV